MANVFRPLKPPPKLNEYATLSSEAQKTLAALEQKYWNLLNRLQTPVVRQHDPANYYKSIYSSSFKKRLNTHYSGRGAEENCSESPSECFAKIASKQATEHVQEFNNISHKSRKGKQSNWKDYIFLKQHSRSKPVTEVFLESRPSDEEIAESVLLLTQRTSRPDSPYMDLIDNLVKHQSNEDRISKPSISGDCGMKNAKSTTCLSQSTVSLSRSQSQESHLKPLNLIPGGDNDLLSQAAIGMMPLYNINQTEAITDLLAGSGNSENEDQSVIFSTLDNNYKSDANLDILNSNKENINPRDCKNALSINRRNNQYRQPPTALKAIDQADFELCLSGTEYSQSQFNVCSENRVESHLFRSYSSANQFTEEESLFEKGQKGTERNMPVSDDYENPFDEKNSKNGSTASVTKKTKKYASKRTALPLKIATAEKSSFENESPYMEATKAEQNKQVKSCKNSSTTKLCGRKVSGCGNQQKINEFFSTTKCRMDNSTKNCAQVQKRSSELFDNAGAKKDKKSFKPPYKDKLDLSVNSREESDVINLSSLTLEKQEETFTFLESLQYLTLTLLYSTNLSSATTFYSAADHAKKKNSSFRHQIVGIAILEGGSTSRCFLIPSDLICRIDIKKEYLHLTTLHTPPFPQAESLLGVEYADLIKEQYQCSVVISKDYIEERRSLIGIPCRNLEDPVIACWLVDPENQPSSFIQMCKTAKIQCSHNEDSWVDCLQSTPKLMLAFRHKLKADKLWPIFKLIEMKLIPVLACMETHTIKVDTELFVKFSGILRSKIKKLEEAIYKEAGHHFSLNSHVQLRQVLYEELELDKKLSSEVKIGRTDVSNQKSTCESSLNLLAVVHPLPALVLEYRQKLMSTYVEGMMSCVTNGSLMTHWDQTAAATGRLTSSQPNVQAVPKSVITITDFQTKYVIGSEKITNVYINAREPFISSPGYVFLAADFQQIELRVLAHLSGDSSLQGLFWNTSGEDVFMSFTKQWHKKAQEEVTYADREQTKRVVYSVMYGVGKDKLSEYLKVKPDIAQDIITSFMKQFPSIETFTKKCWMYAQHYGYTETVCGRRRYFPHITNASPVLRAQARRQAVNFCVQGSAADICKLAMLAVENKLQEHSHLSCRLLLQIHDELIWEVPVEHLLEIKGVVQQVMEDTKALCGTLFSLAVPLTVALNSGKSWAHLNPCVM